MAGGQSVTGLLDTGCSQTVVSERISKHAEEVIPTNAVVVMMNGLEEVCTNECVMRLNIQGNDVTVRCLVAGILKGVDILLGMDVIMSLGGVQITSTGEPLFVMQRTCAVTALSNDVVIDDKDFVAKFSQGKWLINWKWKHVQNEPEFHNYISQYKVASNLQTAFNEEVQGWITQGWLKPYTGPYKCLIPLLAVMQSSKHKVRPVLDYRELNEHVSSHTGESVVCGEKLRKWRSMGINVKLLDLRKAYLQLHIAEDLWKYQVTKFQGKIYCLTRLGFGLNVAPKIMTAVVNAILSSDPEVRRGTDSYIDDIIINEDIVSCERVQKLLMEFGLEAKPSESLLGGRVLGLRIVERNGELRWRRDNQLEEVKPCMKKRDVFSLCGKLVGHFPVAAWLRPACSFIKRSTNGMTWNDNAGPKTLLMLSELMKSIKNSDPVQGRWMVRQTTYGRLWCDASSLAVGVALEIDGDIVEDGCWLRKEEDASHINLAELDAVVRGLSLATKWNVTELEIMTDSATVYGWMNSTILKEKRIKVHGMSDVLVRRRLGLIEDVISECQLTVRVLKVSSDQNKADKLTRVPKKWLSRDIQNIACVAEKKECNLQHALTEIHRRTHFGANRTLYFARKYLPNEIITKDDVTEVIKHCPECQSIDPAPIQWEKGDLDVKESWHRLAADVTHYHNDRFLTIIDCGPSRFAIWKRIKDESCEEICGKFEDVFREKGPPMELLLDNARVFRSTKLQELCNKWGVLLVFRCVNRPSGNGIIERHHRTIKRIASRTGKKVADMVFWYNFSPKDGLDKSSTPCSGIFTHEWRGPGMPTDSRVSNEATSPNFPIGAKVFVKPVDARCSNPWGSGMVTGPGRENQSVEVDGLPRHVSDVRLAPATSVEPTNIVRTNLQESSNRPVRERRPPAWHRDYNCDLSDQEEVL
jgi:ribonuclease HI